MPILNAELVDFIHLGMLVEAVEYFVEGRIGGAMFNNMVKDVLQDRDLQQ